MLICNYGCGQEAKHKQTNGKWCCKLKYNSCPEIRRKNSKGLEKAYEEGRKEAWPITNDQRAWSRGKTAYSDPRITANRKYDPEKVFIKDSPYNGKVAKKIIIAENIFEYKCSECGISSWNDKPLVLEMDHKNGNRYDHRLDNLRFLCLNCHSQTDNFRGKKVTGKEKVTESEIVAAAKISDNINQILNKLKLSQNSTNRPRIERVMKKFNLTFNA